MSVEGGNGWDVEKLRYYNLIRVWISAVDAGHDRDGIPHAIYLATTGKELPAAALQHPESVYTAMGLADFIFLEEFGRSLNSSERGELLEVAEKFMNRGGRSKYRAALIAVVLALPYVVAVVAFVVFSIKGFSWLVTAFAALAIIWIQIARRAASAGNKMAGLHVALSLALVLASLIISFISMFSIHSFH